MKKRSIGLIVLACSSVFCIGTSWFTGRVIEQNIKVYSLVADSTIASFLKNAPTEQTNQLIKLKRLDRGLFSTIAYYQLFIEQTPYDFSVHIEHGPFPLHLLKQGLFSPTMFYGWIELPNHPLFNILRTYTEDNTAPMTVEVIATYYPKDILVKINVPATEIDEKFFAYAIKTTGITIEMNIHYTSSTPSPNSEKQKDIANIHISTGKLDYYDKKAKIQFMIEQFIYNMGIKSSSSHSLPNYRINSSIKSLHINQTSILGFESDLLLEHIDLPSLISLLSFHQLSKNELLSNINKFSANSPVITLHSLIIKNGKAESKHSGMLQIRKQIDKIETIFSIIKYAEYQYKTDITLINSILSKLKIIPFINKNILKVIAKHFDKRIAVYENNKATLKFIYKYPNSVLLNNKKITLDEFLDG